MKVSTKGRYAIIAMIELALHDKKGLLPLADLSLSHDISISYLEQLFARLRNRNLVTGVRGPRGGYRLSRSADDISIADILKAVDEKANPYNTQSNDEQQPLTHILWNELSKKMHNFLNEISLAETLENPEVHGWLEEQPSNLNMNTKLHNATAA